MQHADKIAVGQPADVFIVGRSARETPPLPGRVDYAAADRIVDTRTGRAAGIPFGAPPRAGEAVDVFVRTAERTALDYFIQPLRAQLRRAMREP
jgi:multidrug efflux pump subunit AcrA (membrane-fusion protein)